MSRTKYPPECPVFETTTYGPRLWKGAIVEATGDFGVSIDGETIAIEIDGTLPNPALILIGVRAVDDADVIDDDPRSRHPEHGWYRAGIYIDGLRPLTRAAREMLALVMS